MMGVSKIGFCDFSGGALNFVRRGKRGDCEVSPGCDNCWALAVGERFRNLPEKTTWYPEKLRKLALMKFPEFSPKRGAPHKPMAFVCDTGDLFHENVPDWFIHKAIGVMAGCDVIWQLLTKRARRLSSIAAVWDNELPDNIWLGVSVENQDYTWRIDELMKINAAVRFVSLEPMLSAIDIEDYLPLESYVSCMETPDGSGVLFREGLDWIVLGAESGPNRRTFRVEWAADILHQCQEADVPCFLKQGSGLYPGKSLLVDGREWKEWPNG